MSEPTKTSWRIAGEEFRELQLRLGAVLAVQCAPNAWSLRSVSRVLGQRRIFWEHPIGWDTFRSPLLVAGSDP